MYSFSFDLTTSYANLGTLLSDAGASPVVNPESMANGFFRNTDDTDTVFIASGYNTAPSTDIGTVGPGAVLLFNSDFNANLCWVKSSANTPTLDFIVGSGGYPATTAVGATVSPTPSAGQWAQWASATAIAGVDTINKSYLVTTISTTASASVSPAASASGTFYRMSHASAQLNLPATATCTVGKTVFAVEFTNGLGSVAFTGGATLEGGSLGSPTDYSTVLYQSISTGSGTVAFSPYQYAEFQYVAAGTWLLVGALYIR